MRKEALEKTEADRKREDKLERMLLREKRREVQMKVREEQRKLRRQRKEDSRTSFEQPAILSGWGGP